MNEQHPSYGFDPSDEATHVVSAPSEHYRGYVSAPQMDDSAVYAPPPAPAGSGPWRTIAIVLALALVAMLSFLAFSTVLKRGTSENAVGSQTVAPAPSQTGSSAGGSSSSSNQADFPAEAVTQCTQVNATTNKDELVENVDAQDVRMKENAATSCGFLDATRGAVVAHLQSDSGATNFTVSPFSGRLNKTIDLSCRRQGSFTYCEGGTSAKIWVRNP